MQSTVTQVGIVMGSDLDLPIMSEAAEVLQQFGIPFEMTVASVHRTPDRVLQYAREAEKRHLEVIIAGAGKASHLPGIIAAHTILPVIGVPIKSTDIWLDEQAALLSMLQMPTGTPVAVVGMNAARNAALLATKILAVKDRRVRELVREYRRDLAEEVTRKAATVEKAAEKIRERTGK